MCARTLHERQAYAGSNLHTAYWVGEAKGLHMKPSAGIQIAQNNSSLDNTCYKLRRLQRHDRKRWLWASSREKGVTCEVVSDLGAEGSQRRREMGEEGGPAGTAG